MNQLARLFVLVGVVTVGALGVLPLPASAQPVAAGYVFENGDKWGFPTVGLICRSTIDSNGNEVPVRAPKEILRVYGAEGDSVRVEIATADIDVFSFLDDPTAASQSKDIGQKGYVIFEFSSTATGVVIQPLLVTRTNPDGGFFQWFVDGAVSFRLTPTIPPDPTSSMPRTVFDDSLAGSNSPGFAQTTHAGITIKDDVDLAIFAGKNLVADMAGLETVKFPFAMEFRAARCTGSVRCYDPAISSSNPWMRFDPRYSGDSWPQNGQPYDFIQHIGWSLPRSLDGGLAPWRWKTKPAGVGVFTRLADQDFVSFEVNIAASRADSTGTPTNAGVEITANETISYLALKPRDPFAR